MELRILGPLEVLDEDRPVPLGGKRQQALLALLATRPNEVVSTDRLVEDLWGETAPEGVANALQAAVSRLRRALQPALPGGGAAAALVTRAPGYVLEADPETIDAARFERLAAEGRRALVAGDPDTAASLLAEALDLWRGPALAEFVYEPFAQDEIARLEELRLAATEDRIEADLAGARHSEVVGELQTLSAHHPLRERPRAQLMVALYRSGRQSEALEVYRQYRETLAEELGIDPGPELRELELKVLRQDPDLAPPPRSLARLAAAEPSKPAAAPERRPVAPPARKTVTIVFADLAESTVLAERLDAEALKEVIARYFEVARNALHRHGGTVEKFIGDAVMAVFGIPVVHEDDALRALRAAKDLQAGLEELNLELQREWGLRLTVRIGVNTGEVVTGEAAPGQGLVTGDPVNTAVRLQQVAAPGEVLVGEMTHALVAAAVVAEPVEALEVKGKPNALQAWRIDRVLPGVPPIPRRLDTRFVGREAELAQLNQAFGRAVKDRSAYLFTVLGAPGVGKSRLGLEFCAALEHESTVLTGRCLPYGEGITFWPLREILQNAFGEDVRGGVEEELDGRLDGPQIAECLGAAVGQADRAFTTEEIRWAARTALEALAAARPLVVVLEDLHWAERAFLDLVDHVADLTTNAPILLLCVARPDLLEIRPDWAGGKRNATTIELEPLEDGPASLLVGELLDSAGLRPVQDRIVSAGEGNPLFLEQITATLDEIPLSPRDGDVPLPPSIQALLAARLERLGPGERAVLERAAIVGKEFSEQQAAALLPEEIHATLSRHLEALIRRRFIRTAPSAVARQGPYRFRHGLIQEAAYRGLSKRLRADLHERFANWFERDSQRHADEVEEILGYHLEQAYRYQRELGDLGDPDLAASARRHLTAAEQRAMSRRDYSAAFNLSERTLALARPDEIDTLLEIDRLDSLRGIGRIKDGIAVADVAANRAAVLGDRVAELTLRLAGLQLGMFIDPDGWEARMETLLAQALPELETARDDLGLYVAYAAAGSVALNRGRADAHIKALERSLEHARRLGSPRYDEWVEIASAHFYGSTPVPEMLGWLDEQEAYGHRHHELRLCRASALAMLDRTDEARALIAEVRGELRERGGLMELAVGAHWPAYVELLAGNPSGAEQYLAEAFDFLEEQGDRGIRSTLAANRAIAYYDLGRLEEADEWAARAAEVAGGPDVFTQLAETRVRAKVLAHLGEDETAEQLAHECVALAEGTDFLNAQGDAHYDLSEVLLTVGKAEAAVSALHQAQARYERKGNLVMVERVRAKLAQPHKAEAGRGNPP